MKGKAIMFVTPDQAELLSNIEKLTNVEIHQQRYEDFKPGPEPRRVVENREKAEAQREAARKQKGRVVDSVPDKEQGVDATKFPGGIVPKALPKKRLGGRIRTRRS